MKINFIKNHKINNTEFCISSLKLEDMYNTFKVISEAEQHKKTSFKNVKLEFKNIKLIYISNFKNLNLKEFHRFFNIPNISEIEVYTTKFKKYSLKNPNIKKQKEVNKKLNKKTEKIKNEDKHIFFIIEINSNCKMIDVKLIDKKVENIIKNAKKKNIKIGFNIKTINENKKSDNKDDNYYFANIYTSFTDLNDDVSNVLMSNMHDNLYDKYTYVYDKVCEKLDQNFMVNNFCKFENDKCIANRDTNNIERDNGCCHSFVRGKYEPHHKTTEELELCSYLGEDKQCQIKCIACKFFVCQYLKDRGVYLDILDNFLLRAVLNKKQLDVIHINFFKTEDQIVKKLIKVKKNILPYRLFILLRGQLIDNYWKKKDIKQKG